jgi:predicted nucleotidyltransferase
MVTQHAALVEVSQFANELRQLAIPLRKVILFGSHARNEQREESDIDVAIVSPDFTGGPLDVRPMAHLLARFLFSISSRTPSHPSNSPTGTLSYRKSSALVSW